MILEEVASVLNMHLSRIGTWSWPEEGVAVEMRRALNGKYRFFMDEELLLVSFLSMTLASGYPYQLSLGSLHTPHRAFVERAIQK
jgi:hypothetical protein